MLKDFAKIHHRVLLSRTTRLYEPSTTTGDPNTDIFTDKNGLHGKSETVGIYVENSVEIDSSVKMSENSSVIASQKPSVFASK